VNLPVYIGPDAVPELVRYTEERGLRCLLLVADERTHAALGARVAEALTAAGRRVDRALLRGEEVIADAARILEVLLAAKERPDAYVAVGAGTITDITRFVSHRAGVPFISVPTAPSVDGFASVNAPLVIGRFKRTVGAQGPAALYADLPTLCAAPRPMIAAGYGDMLGKYTSLADWRLSQIVWGDPYDEEIAAQTRDALERTVAHTAEIGAADPEGIRALLQALIDSGLSMLRFGDSRPASGAEHHLSHFWEMRLLLADKPAILHGAKVGVGCVRVARWYERIRGMGQQEAARRLKSTPLPALDIVEAGIHEVYGPAAEQIIAYHQDFLGLTPAAHRALCERVLAAWDAIREVAAQVPAPAELSGYLRTVGGPTTADELGVGEEEAARAERYAHYLRPRFTVLKLARLLGLL